MKKESPKRGRGALSIVQKYFPQVKIVVDAGRPRIIEVEDQDLKKSNVQSHKSCAMAVACKRSLHLDGVLISRKVAYLVRGDKAIRYLVPEAVSREIVAFDRGAGFAPGTYRLVPFPPFNRLGVHKPTGPKKSKATHQPRFRHVTSGIRAMLGAAETV
jgi:hypothetical protein